MAIGVLRSSKSEYEVSLEEVRLMIAEKLDVNAAQVQVEYVTKYPEEDGYLRSVGVPAVANLKVTVFHHGQ
jgi:hypothetical protein